MPLLDPTLSKNREGIVRYAIELNGLEPALSGGIEIPENVAGLIRTLGVPNSCDTYRERIEADRRRIEAAKQLTAMMPRYRYRKAVGAMYSCSDDSLPEVRACSFKVGRLLDDNAWLPIAKKGIEDEWHFDAAMEMAMTIGHFDSDLGAEWIVHLSTRFGNDPDIITKLRKEFVYGTLILPMLCRIIESDCPLSRLVVTALAGFYTAVRANKGVWEMSVLGRSKPEWHQVVHNRQPFTVSNNYVGEKQ